MDFNEWLESLGLSRYAELFAENAIDEVGILAQLSEEEFDSLGVSLGARKKIQIALSEEAPRTAGPPLPTPSTSSRIEPKRKTGGEFLAVAFVLGVGGLIAAFFVFTSKIDIPPVGGEGKIVDFAKRETVGESAIPEGEEDAQEASSPLVEEVPPEDRSPPDHPTDGKFVDFELGHVGSLSYGNDILPLLESYCHSCHGGETVKGSVDLAAFATADSLMAERKFWLNVLEQIETEEMPTKEPLPTKKEREVLVEWLDHKLNDIDWSSIREAGHVTIPRLTHVEYRNTMRDLLGVEIKAAASFSADGEGQSGFTTDRENLFITPSAMEKYFAAAEEAVNAIPDTNIEPIKIKLEAEEMASPAKPQEFAGSFTGRRLTIPQTTLYDMIEFPADGEYTFVVQGISTDGPIAGVRLRINDEVKGDVVIEGGSPSVGRLTCFVSKGTHQVAWNKENSVLPRDIRKKLKRGVFFGAMAIDWMGVAGPVSRTTPKQSILIAPSPSLPPSDAAARTITVFAQRAFRRPVGSEELRRYFSIYQKSGESGMDYDEAIKMALTAMLVSPHFLFRHEFAPSGNLEGEFEFDHFQIASRLSYFLWLSMPDPELFQLATSGKLKDPEVLRAQVRRMIKDPKSRSFTAAFLGQWLGFESVGEDLIPDKKVFPAFNQRLADAMKQETVLTFEHLIKADHSLEALLDTKATFLNDQLAKLYRVPGIKGSEMRPVRLADPNRGGLLGMASILTATSSSTRTSPVLRGKWVLETLLGEDIPEPPADAGELPPDAGNTGRTLREELEIHRNKPDCQGCHDKIDPIGFGLENFDGIGKFRAKHNGKPIDSRGELGGFAFSGIDELKAWLKRERKDEFVRNMTERMLAFALGRELKTYDEGAVGEIIAALEGNDNRAITLIEEIVLSYPFQHQNNSPSEY